MTAIAPAPESLVGTIPAVSPYRLTFGRLLRSEWIKLVSLRSTWWSLGVAAFLSVGLAVLIASASASFEGGFDPVSAILSPTQFTMLVAGILGAMVVTGEYSTGMIRSSLTAEPRRGAVMAAKAVVVALVMAVSTVLSYGLAIAATSPFLETQIDWAQPDQSIVPLALGVLTMVAFTLLGLGFGFLIRNGAGAIAATVGVVFVLPIVFSLFSMAGEGWQWLVDLTEYLPMNAAGSLVASGNDDLVPPLLTLAGWVLAPLAAGWAVLRFRDA